MNDGTTPLVLAARLAVEGLVEELSHCHADINAVDDHGQLCKSEAVICFVSKYSTSGLTFFFFFNLFMNIIAIPGKSALHWAAAVNNVEATLVLLKNGANRDMQDNKVSSNRVLCCLHFGVGLSTPLQHMQ